MRNKKILLLFFPFLLIACKSGPQPIEYNKDECAHCRMIITDPRFGSELVSEKGKIHKFDSIECLADYVNLSDESSISTLWISDYANPNTLIKAESAYYIVSPLMKSPMGKNIGGFKSKDDFEKVYTEMKGQRMNWKDVLMYVKNSN